jgi:hypothetical protein
MRLKAIAIPPIELEGALVEVSEEEILADLLYPAPAPGRAEPRGPAGA